MRSLLSAHFAKWTLQYAVTHKVQRLNKKSHQWLLLKPAIVLESTMATHSADLFVLYRTLKLCAPWTDVCGRVNVENTWFIGYLLPRSCQTQLIVYSRYLIELRIILVYTFRGTKDASVLGFKKSNQTFDILTVLWNDKLNRHHRHHVPHASLIAHKWSVT